MKSERGGFLIGLVVGLLIGLALALGVALYVTKVPVPFVNKVPPRSAAQDAAEADKNRNWDPNGALAGKSAPKPGAAASAPAPAAAPAPKAPAVEAPRAATRDPAVILGDKPAPGQSSATGEEPFTYFVQAGAYARTEEAEQQRARLAMLGYGAKVTEREQSGRTVYRVRVGPFDKREEAEGVKDRLGGSGVDAALVRVQK